MNMYWIYDLPNWLLGLGIVSLFAILSVAGLFATRPLAKKLLKASSQHNDVVSSFVGGIGVFYGLALGLIAVGTWENFSQIDAQVSTEAAQLASLYRDLDGYPLPLRTDLETKLREYTKLVVEKEWPAHQRGDVPEQGTLVLDAIEDQIMEFEPVKERDKINHAEILHTLNKVVEQRRLRLQSVGSGLPAALWWVVVIGAWLNIGLTYLFWVENLTLHALLIAIMAIFIGLLIFLTAAMDNPFRGHFSVSSDAFQTILDNVMKPPAKS